MRYPRARFAALVIGLGVAGLAGGAGVIHRPAAALEAEGRYRLIGEGAARVHDPVEPTRLRVRTEVELKTREGFTWRGTVAVRAFRDGALDRSRYSPAVRAQQGSEVELKELTFGVALGPFDLVAGRRQVAWGALFGQFVADRVMPFDLRDFLLAEPDFIRRSLWMVSALAIGERLSAEALFILERRADRLPVSGSEFAPAPGAPIEDRDPSRVALADVEPALRVEGRAGGVDLSVFALAAHPDIDPLATAGELGERDPVVGVTAGSAFGPYALRGEAALERDRPQASGGTEDVLRAGLVIDRALPRAQSFSLQCVHESAAALGVAEDERTEVALRWSGDPAGSRWTTEIEYHHGFDGDWLLRPRAGYAIGSAWLAECGVDWFGGGANTTYGQFDRQDRITLAITRAGQWAAGASSEPRSQPAGGDGPSMDGSSRDGSSR